MYGWKWLIMAFLSALAAMAIVVIALWLPFGWATLVIAVGVLVFIVVLILNPDYWHRRLAATIISSWLTISSAGSLRIDGLWGEGNFAYFVLERVGLPFHLVVGAVVVVLLFFDFWKSSSLLQEMETAVRQSHADSGRPSKEQLTRIIPSNDRARLMLSALLDSHEVLPVDPANLTKAQQYDIAIKQIAARERRRNVTGLSLTIFAVLALVLIVSQVSPINQPTDSTADHKDTAVSVDSREGRLSEHGGLFGDDVDTTSPLISAPVFLTVVVLGTTAIICLTIRTITIKHRRD